MTSYSKRKKDHSYSKKKDYSRRENVPVGIQERQSHANMSRPKSKGYTMYEPSLSSSEDEEDEEDEVPRVPRKKNRELRQTG